MQATQLLPTSIEGYRLIHQDSYDVGDGVRRYDGIFVPGTDDRTIIWNYRYDDFRAKEAEMRSRGHRLIHQHSYNVGDGVRRYDGIFVPGSVSIIFWNYRYDDFRGKVAELRGQGYRLIHQHSYDVGDGVRRYDGIWEQGHSGPIFWNYRYDDFRAKVAELQGQGFRLAHQHSYDVGDGVRRYDGIFISASDDRPIVWNYRYDDFRAKEAELRRRGYRLLHQHSYDVGDGVRRYDGIWIAERNSLLFWNYRYDDFKAKTSELYTTRICVSDRCLSMAKMFQAIQGVLNNQTVGYGFVITCRGGAIRIAGGKSRTLADPPEQNFSVYSRMNIASINKTITAVAVLQLLDARGLTIDSTISNYLPSDWVRGANINSVTFKQLLTHTSGIQNPNPNAVSYDDLKNLIQQGVSTDKSPRYQNQNFALFRIIIPYLNGLTETRGDKASALSRAYLDYINTHIFTPIGITQRVIAAPVGNNPSLFYPFPAKSSRGSSFGDWSLICGGGGLHLSVNELSIFLNRLRFGNQLLTDSQRKLMDDNLLGWGARHSVTNGTGLLHGGFLFFYASDHTPDNPRAGTMNGCIVDFSIGVQVALIYNSPSPNNKSPEQIVFDAYEAAWESK